MKEIIFFPTWVPPKPKGLIYQKKKLVSVVTIDPYLCLSICLRRTHHLDYHLDYNLKTLFTLDFSSATSQDVAVK
jgi:hypothetical protein